MLNTPHTLGRLFARQWAAYVERCQQEGKNPREHAVTLRVSRVPAATPRTYRRSSVYIAKVGDGLYKVGYSTDVRARLKSFSITHPYPLELVHTFPVDHAIPAERRIHRLLRDYHVRGELFRIDDWTLEDLKRITEVKRGVIVRRPKD